jgi:hypothetical protein
LHAQPAKTVQYRCKRLLAMTLLIGVVNAQDELAAVPACE